MRTEGNGSKESGWDCDSVVLGRWQISQFATNYSRTCHLYSGSHFEGDDTMDVVGW